MKKVGVYILLCDNERYYVGSTNDFNRRFSEHKGGQVNSTKNILPVKLMFFQECDKLIDARKLEYQIKTKKSKVIIEKIIKDQEIRSMGLWLNW